jgi:hypothetical protein
MYVASALDYNPYGAWEPIAQRAGTFDLNMRNDQRQFYIYDLEVGARKAGASIPNMATVVAVWQKLAQAGQTHPIRHDAATLLVGDIHIDHARGVVTLLVRLSDKSAPNAVYSDPAQGHFQEHIKVGNQGGDLGCHVFISLTPEANLPHTYTCAIERVPGVSADLVRRVLSKYLNYEHHSNPAFHEYPHPNGGLDRQGNPRMERCCPHIELRGRPSDTLINDINNGHISGISLIKHEMATPIGGAAYLTKHTSELKLGIDHNHLPANIWNSLRGAFRRNAGAYPVAKIAYRTPGSSRGVTVEIDANTGAPLSELYVKSFELSNIFPLLAQSAERIVPHLRDMAIPHFVAERHI